MTLHAWRSRVRTLVVAGLLATMAAPADAHAASTTLRTGFMDDEVLRLGDVERPAWLRRATDVGASVMRVNLFWEWVAPVQPPADRAPDPTWSGYDFAAMDGQVRAAQAAGMTVLLNVSRAPRWAEGSDKDSSVSGYPGNWKPNVAAFREFMKAVSRRYSGATQDAAAPGQMLPRVRDFQIWNEPNLNLYLAPQYEGGKAFAATRWRDLLNAGYGAIKGVQPTANVVAAGLAPFGDPPSDAATRTGPVAFMRSTLCLSASLRKTCGTRTFADTISLHPYAVDRPGRPARNSDDATIPDLARVTRVVRAARRAGTVGPKLPRTWVTEMSYDTSPPDPKGVPITTRARYISESMWRLWRAGATTIVWYLMRDAAPEPNYASSYQSGFYSRAGRVKGDAAAFRFPLLVTSRSPSRLSVWLRSPGKGAVRVQVRRRGKWTTAATVKTTVDGVRRLTVTRKGVTGVRGVSGVTKSYVWPVS